MTEILGCIWDKDSMSRDLTKGIGYFIRRDKHEILAIELKLNGVKRVFKKAEKGINV